MSGLHRMSHSMSCCHTDFGSNRRRFDGGEVDAYTASIQAKVLRFLDGGMVDVGGLRLQALHTVLAATQALLREGTPLLDPGEALSARLSARTRRRDPVLP